jgi:hypothetical protein
MMCYNFFVGMSSRCSELVHIQFLAQDICYNISDLNLKNAFWRILKWT